MRKFNLTHLEQLFNADDDVRATNYITHNLAVARQPQIALLLNAFQREPMLLHERRMLIITRGWTAPVINLIPRRFEAGDLVYMGRDGIVQFTEMSPDIQGIAFSLSDELFALAMGLHLSDDELQHLDRLHDLLYRNTRVREGSSQVTLHLIAALLWQVHHLWQQRQTQAAPNVTREQSLFADFIQLVNQHAPQEHNLPFYASRLCLSPRYMSTLVRQVSGRAAKEWIDDALATRIKVALRHSDKPVGQISDELSFPNTAFFSKFFRRMTGQTPTEYRRAVAG